jgi:hypothetical protein
MKARIWKLDNVFSVLGAALLRLDLPQPRPVTGCGSKQLGKPVFRLIPHQVSKAGTLR